MSFRFVGWFLIFVFSVIDIFLVFLFLSCKKQDNTLLHVYKGGEKKEKKEKGLRIFFPIVLFSVIVAVAYLMS